VTTKRPKSTSSPRPKAAPASSAAGAGDAAPEVPPLSMPLQQLAQLRLDYLQQAAELWNRSLMRLHGGGGDTAAPIADKRFKADAWASNPAASFMAEMYLLNARTLMELAEQVPADAKGRERVRFAVQQWVDAASPSNYLALNPEAQRKAVESGGESLAHGLQQLWHDIRQGHMSQTDESRFEVGGNLAVTPGSVVFENDLFQLIEYAPSTPKVFARPLLMVPPCINKYYILDLQPQNSLIAYAVAHGHRVFVMSWCNPDESVARKTWDDYIEDGAIRAIETVQDITGQETINTLGFCVGGTILTTALAVLAARGTAPAESLTLLTTFLDFENTGIIDIFVDEASVRMREMTLGPDSPGGGSLLPGSELASTFSFLRPNDLVWNYVVGNYLKGETPPPFDLLYWNSDSTNLPGPMFCWYLRNTYLENNLVKPGKVTVCGVPLDFSAVGMPAYIYASKEDHIVPWDGAYRNTKVLPGKKRFVLGASGHIAGVINPPVQKKRSHWIGSSTVLGDDPTAWFEKAAEHEGSWWPDWAAWLEHHAGKQVAAPRTPGNRTHRPIEPAPGRYVKQKAL